MDQADCGMGEDRKENYYATESKMLSAREILIGKGRKTEWDLLASSTVSLNLLGCQFIFQGAIISKASDLLR